MQRKVFYALASVLVILMIAIAVQKIAHDSKPQTLGQHIDEAVEEVHDEIDDHTTAN